MKKIIIETSARHCHLSQKDSDILFGKGYIFKKVRELSQKGQFLTSERVDIEVNGFVLKNLAVLIPLRKETQVEISLTDSKKLKQDINVALSGELKNSVGCSILKNNKQVNIKKGLIVAKNHIHCDLKTAKKLNITEKDKVSVVVKGKRPIVFKDVDIRIDKSFSWRFHIDTDESNACGNSNIGFVV